jgi:hypothetical protein
VTQSEEPQHAGTEADKAARVAQSSRKSLKKRLLAETAKLQQYEAEAAEMRATIGLIETAQDSKNADLEARDYPPTEADYRKQVDQLAVLRKQLAAKERGGPLQRRKIENLQEQIAAKEAEFKVKMGPVITDLTTFPLTQCREIIETLEPFLIRLMAADMVRIKYLGDRFPVAPGTTPPPAGGVIVQQLIAGLPKHVRPENLTLEALMPAARRLQKQIVEQIEG